MDKYDEAEALITKVLARPENDANAPSEYGLVSLSRTFVHAFTWVDGSTPKRRRVFERHWTVILTIRTTH
jgi:hypothetical protein